MYTSSLSSNAKVDVFLSFREEIRGGFVSGFLSHLRHALARQSITCFIDNQEEERTEKRKQLSAKKVLHAIPESKVAVVVLSKNYASSSWSLNELAEIMETNLMMVPVYYEVDISDVRYQKGSFGEDLRRHGQSESSQTMKRWKACLTKLTDTKPEFSPQTSKDEAKLVRDITRHVSGLLSTSRLPKNLLPGKTCEDKPNTRMTSWSRRVSDSNKIMATISGKSYSPIAMDRQTDSIYEILKLECTSEVYVIAVTGVAGIGKTTIARHLFNKLSSRFEESCFFEASRNILDDSSQAQRVITSSATKNINQNLSTACYQNHYSLEISRNFLDQGHDLSALFGSHEKLLSPKSRKRKARQTLGDEDNKRRRICKKRVLIIVDNIGIEDLEMVMKGVNRFCPGSRVIVTTEDKSLLLARGVEHVYEMDCLKYDEGLELFSECAFQKQYPPANFEQLSARAVEVTGCLPLALKLLGSSLRDRTEEEWECEILRLEARQDADLPKETPIGSAPGLSKFKAQGIGSAPGPKELWEYKCIGSKLEQQKER
ncbi:disease resistance protein TAO1 isoform X1 [Brassica rapa]|uniref:disease resistance protein TAO1 isoform X1 n=1 Tax=Brassica campestris TaxID=3711 RepID=UPI00087255C7|nr:disease resistance protein TAO1 isoform X1 [Brassica rapa]